MTPHQVNEASHDSKGRHSIESHTLPATNRSYESSRKEHTKVVVLLLLMFVVFVYCFEICICISEL